jgi:hypothetical protein
LVDQNHKRPIARRIENATAEIASIHGQYASMPISCCAVCCGIFVRWLEELSKKRLVIYCRCETCAHVWVVLKDDPGEVPHHMTPLPVDTK